MKLNEYQEKARTTAKYHEMNQIIYPALGLAGESGEVCEKIKKAMRSQNFDNTYYKYLHLEPDIFHEELRESVKKELGDVLWYISALCTDFGLSLESVARANIEKLTDRKNRGVLDGEGDNR